MIFVNILLKYALSLDFCEENGVYWLCKKIKYLPLRRFRLKGS